MPFNLRNTGLRMRLFNLSLLSTYPGKFLGDFPPDRQANSSSQRSLGHDCAVQLT